MDADNVSRRHVMKGVGIMTGVGVTGGRGRNRRRGPKEPSKQSEGTAPEPEPQTAWPQLGGNAANTGYRRGARGPKSSIRFRWQITGNQRISGVVVDDSTVYASDARVLSAVSAADGSTQWTLGTDHPLHRVSAPAIGETLVYMGCVPTQSGTHDSSISDASNSGEFGSHVRAVDGETGTEVWRFEPEQSIAMFHAPTVADGVVYTVGQNTGGGTVGRLYALDGENGDLLWSHGTGRSGINGYHAPPVAVADGVVYLAAEELLALDAATGAVYWSIDPDTTYKATGANAPAVTDGRLYVGRGTDTATTFEARSVTDGSLVWTHTVTENRTTNTPQHTAAKPLTGVWTAPAVVDGSVYVGFNERSPRTDRASVVVALHSDTGTVRWQTTFTEDRHTVHTPATTEETLYTGGTALNLDDGTVRWRLDSPPTRGIDTFAPPAIADETVFVGGTSLRAIKGLV